MGGTPTTGEDAGEGTAAARGEPRRQPRAARAALVVHLTSLVVALCVLVYLDRGMWFRADDFDFLTERGLHGATLSLWAPHTQHWVTVPVLIWRAIFVVAKLHTARPYLVTLYVAHLCLAHVLWRVMRRSGTTPFVATALAALFALLGSGAENLVWAFQLCFVSSVLLGWVMTMLVDHDGPGIRRDVAAVLVGVVALMTSGVAVTMVAVAGIVAFARRGWKAAAAVVTPCAAVFLTWFALSGRHAGGTPQSLGSTLRAMPGYVWAGLSNSLSAATGSTTFGPVLFVAVVLFAAWRARQARGPVAPALAGVAGVVLFFVVASTGRDAVGPREAESSRYVYVAVALLLPAIALAVTALVRRSRWVAVAGLAVLTLVGTANFHVLFTYRDNFVAVSQATERQLAAAVEVAARGPIVPGTLPLGNSGAPSLSVPVMEALARAGDLPSGVRYGPGDVVNAATALQLGATSFPLFPTRVARLQAFSTSVRTSTTALGCTAMTAESAGSLVAITTDAPASLSLTTPEGRPAAFVATLHLDGATGRPVDESVHRSAPWWDIAASPAVVDLQLGSGVTLTACAAPAAA